MVVVSSMVSRVVPSMSDTIARSSPNRALRSVDLPTLVLPTIATGIPDFKTLPAWKLFAKDDTIVDLFGEGIELGTVGKLKVLMVGEVEFQFEQGGHLQQAFAQRGELLAEPAFELTHGEPVLCRIGGGDEVRHRLRLREIHLAVEERALGILAWLRLTCAMGLEQHEDALDDIP